MDKWGLRGCGGWVGGGGWCRVICSGRGGAMWLIDAADVTGEGWVVVRGRKSGGGGLGGCLGGDGSLRGRGGDGVGGCRGVGLG